MNKQIDGLPALLAALTHATALAEFAVLAACLVLALLATRLVRGGAPQPSSSIWFGKHLVDGVLFPALALLAAVVARHALEGVVPIAVFRLAIPILLALVVIRVIVRVLSAALPRLRFVRVIERSVSWLVWLGLVLWLTGVLPLMLAGLDSLSWKVGGTQLSMRNLVEGVLSAVFVLMIVLWVSAAIEARLLAGAIENLSVRKMAANSTRALLLFVGLMLALSAAGIDITAFGVLGGAIGVGLGFGLQKLASNYVSGFVILAERNLRIGDTVKVDNFEGRITDIKTRATIIRAANGRESIVPNEMLTTLRVENASLAQEPAVMTSTVVQVAYGTDVTALREKILAALAGLSRVAKDGKHVSDVHLTDFTAGGLELTVWYWNGDPHNGQSNLRSEVNLAILGVLDAEGIEIAHAQRIVHPRPVRGAGAAPPAAA
ncbi:MAG: mechanosensitive ion channel [Methylibium sp.]|nr:mechanosensitive ion channel [Methylibium sp.]